MTPQFLSRMLFPLAACAALLGCVQSGGPTIRRTWADLNTLNQPAFFYERLDHLPTHASKVDQFRWMYGKGPGKAYPPAAQVGTPPFPAPLQSGPTIQFAPATPGAAGTSSLPMTPPGFLPQPGLHSPGIEPAPPRGQFPTPPLPRHDDTGRFREERNAPPARRLPDRSSPGDDPYAPRIREARPLPDNERNSSPRPLPPPSPADAPRRSVPPDLEDDAPPTRAPRAEGGPRLKAPEWTRDDEQEPRRTQPASHEEDLGLDE